MVGFLPFASNESKNGVVGVGFRSSILCWQLCCCCYQQHAYSFFSILIKFIEFGRLQQGLGDLVVAVVVLVAVVLFLPPVPSTSMFAIMSLPNNRRIGRDVPD